MKNRKINLDRPQLKTEEILARKNFDEIVRNHHIMSKPFYKQNWFIGTTGLASLGLVIGTTFAFQNNENEKYHQTNLTELNTDAPPNLIVENNNPIILNANLNAATNDLAKKTIVYNALKIKPIEETSTLKDKIEENTIPEEKNTALNIAETEEQNSILINEKVKEVVETDDATENNSFMDLSPRISRKIGGEITRNELFDNKGITTEGDVSVIHFELHLIDGLGGHVFEEEGNQLNEEMRNAIDKVGQGETIYFENIRGKIKNGTEIRLNPLKYVLMN